jgi:hypothetical protein
LFTAEFYLNHFLLFAMDRRKAIKDIAIVSGGLITLPQWMVSCGVSDTTIHQTSFSVAEQKNSCKYH